MHSFHAGETWAYKACSFEGRKDRKACERNGRHARGSLPTRLGPRDLECEPEKLRGIKSRAIVLLAAAAAAARSRRLLPRQRIVKAGPSGRQGAEPPQAVPRVVQLLVVKMHERPDLRGGAGVGGGAGSRASKLLPQPLAYSATKRYARRWDSAADIRQKRCRISQEKPGQASAPGGTGARPGGGQRTSCACRSWGGSCAPQTCPAACRARAAGKGETAVGSWSLQALQGHKRVQQRVGHGLQGQEKPTSTAAACKPCKAF